MLKSSRQQREEEYSQQREQFVQRGAGLQVPLQSNDSVCGLIKGVVGGVKGVAAKEVRRASGFNLRSRHFVLGAKGP